MKPVLPHPAVMITDRPTANLILNNSKLRNGIKSVVSINGRDREAPVGLKYISSVLCLTFDDVERESAVAHGYTPVSPVQVKMLVDFVTTRQETPFLVHCAQGVSRSTAAALIALAVWEGPGREQEAWTRLVSLLKEGSNKHYRGVYELHPNRRMIMLADKIMGRGGKLWTVVSRNMTAINIRYNDFEL